MSGGNNGGLTLYALMTKANQRYTIQEDVVARNTDQEEKVLATLLPPNNDYIGVARSEKAAMWLRCRDPAPFFCKPSLSKPMVFQ